MELVNLYGSGFTVKSTLRRTTPSSLCFLQVLLQDCEWKWKVPQIELHQPAPNFALKDYNGRMTRLSDYRGKRNVLLVFNRGFM